MNIQKKLLVTTAIKETLGSGYDGESIFLGEWCNISGTNALNNRIVNSYLKDSVKSKYSAEESWFTIITYIYGYDSNSIITSKDYESRIPLKSRKIPTEKFKGIETEVLPFYEKLINDLNNNNFTYIKKKYI